MREHICPIPMCNKEVDIEKIRLGIAGLFFCCKEHFLEYMISRFPDFDLRSSTKHPVPTDLTTQGK